MIRKSITMALIVMALFLIPKIGSAVEEDNVIYVDLTATSGDDDGTSWEDAFLNIQDAVDSITDAASDNTYALWVADGTYTSDSATDNVLNMVDYVSVYGGFEGMTAETSKDDADPRKNLTTLDGEGESYHVVRGAEHVVLDGFIITGGYANGPGSFTQTGAGLVNRNNTDMTVSNCVFTNNRAVEDGGAIYALNSDMEITNCKFTMNVSENIGGAIAIYNDVEASEKTIDIINNQFMYNVSLAGGAISIFTEDFEEEEDEATTTVNVTNCTFNFNFGFWGGGSIVSDEPGSYLVVTNSILWNGLVATGDAEIEIVDGSTSETTYNDSDQTLTGTGNINSDPDFLNEPDFIDLAYGEGTTNTISVNDEDDYADNDIFVINNDGVPRRVIGKSGSDELTFEPAMDSVIAVDDPMLLINWGVYNYDILTDLRLHYGSPCVDTGDDTDAPTDDLYGRDRPERAGGDHDMGAHEQKIWYVTDFLNPCPTCDGISWATAFDDIQETLDDYAEAYDIVLVESGYYSVGTGLELKENVNLYSGILSSYTEYGALSFSYCARLTSTGPHIVIGESNVKMRGFNLSGNEASGEGDYDINGGGFFVKDKTGIVLKDVYIHDNDTDDYGAGGGLYSNNTDITIMDSSFLRNNVGSTGYGGGGIYAIGGEVIIASSVFRDNKIDGDAGGAIMSAHNQELIRMTVADCEFTSNESSSYGGSIYQIGFGIKVIDSDFSHTYNPTDDGSAIKCHSSSSYYSDEIIIDNCTFGANAEIWTSQCDVDISNSTIDDAYLSSADVTITESDFKELSLSGVDGTISDSTFVDTTGTGLSISNSSDIELDTCSFEGYTTALAIGGSTVVTTDSVFTDNETGVETSDSDLTMDGGEFYNASPGMNESVVSTCSVASTYTIDLTITLDQYTNDPDLDEINCIIPSP